MSDEPEIRIEPPAPHGAPPQGVRRELADWLQVHGFVPGPNGLVYSKRVLVADSPAKLVVDFKRAPKGARYGYKLDLSEPPEWIGSPSLGDHPELLKFKAFRDRLLTENTKSSVAQPSAPEAAPGVLVAGRTPGEESAEIMDRMDEQQIIREIKGEIKERIIEKYFYRFEHQGRRVVGISYEGVKAIVRRLGHIRTELVRLEEREHGWLAVVKATDLKRNLESVGAFCQPKFFYPSKQPNPFAVTLAVVKAQRNAWRVFIPERVLVETYREWAKQREGEGRGEKAVLKARTEDPR